MRLAILVSHPIQYYAPLFRELARRIDLQVFYAHRATPAQQAQAGFGTTFDWDVDLFDGYRYVFLGNVAQNPDAHHFGGCDTPDISLKLGKGKFDALLVMGWHLKSYWQGVWAAKRSGIRVFVRGDSHLDTPRHVLKRATKEFVYPPLLRVFDAALYVGQRNREYYEHYHYPAERLFVSPHCVDTERFANNATSQARREMRARLGVGSDDKVALFAGKLVEFKRPLDLVEAAAHMEACGRRIQILVAGAGPRENALRARARAAGVQLHLLGFQNQSQMPAAYAAADVLVLPSNGRETWGLVANEALACGVPIVVSDAVGCEPDLANDPQVGRTFPVGDIDALAGALAATLGAPPNLDAIKRVSDAYSLAAAASGILQALTA